MKSLKYIKCIMLMFAILFFMLLSVPVWASFSPLDDPVERYSFEFEEGKYRIDLSYAYFDWHIDCSNPEIFF